MRLPKTLFILITFHMIFFVFAKYNCNTKETVYLNKGTIAYFETTNYPKLLTPKQFAACNLTFALADNDTDSNLIILTTTRHFAAENINQEKTLNFLQISSYSLRINYNKEFQHKSIAQEGYVVFADKNKTLGCPSRDDKNPYAILNEFEYIPIYNKDLFNHTLAKCTWRFSCPLNYGFKVVILEMDVSKDMEIFIKNSTDTFVNKRSVEKTHPYYNEDQYLEIELSNSHNLLFQAYITIVKKNVNTNNCLVKKNSTTTIWQIDTLLIYPFSTLNVKCFFELIIPEATEIVVTIKAFIIEKNVDYIRYYVDQYNNSVTVDVKPNADTVFKLFNYNNGSNQRYLFEYASDGSVASLGTYISFFELSCRCVATVLPSCPEYLNAMTGLMDENDYRYCGNLRCNFTVEPCLLGGVVEMTDLEIRVSSDLFKGVEYKGDLIRTYSNEKLISEFEINYFTEEDDINYYVYFNSSNSVFLEVSTFPSNIVKEIVLFRQATLPLQVTGELEISSSNTFIVIDLNLYTGSTIVKIVVSKESRFDIANPTFTISSNNAYKIQLFNNESLSISYSSRTCFGDLNAYSCKISKNEVAILCPSIVNSYPILIVQLADYHQKGCVLKKYIYTEREFINSPIIAISTPNDECIAKILFETSDKYHFFISDLWTTSLTENVKIFAGSDTIYFEFNSRTAKKWTSIRLFSFIYTIKLPKKATIYIKLEKAPTFNSVDLFPINVPANSTSLFSTPFYGTSKSDFVIGQQDVKYCAMGHAVKFTAIYYNTFLFTMTYNNDVIFPIGKTGDYYILNKSQLFSCIYFNYDYSSLQDINDGVVLLIEAIE